jgi:transcriptional regulator of arginine metabolism
VARASRSSSSASDKLARHTAIRKVIRGRNVATQEQLRRLLADEGFAVTQATLSRDLAQLGALRISRPDGGSHYELDSEEAPAGALRDLADLVVSVNANEAMVVVLTRPGCAQAVANGIDTSRISECLGTLAGDDTIFVSPVRGTPARRLCKRLKHLFGIPE